MKMPEIATCAAGALAVVLLCGLYGCSPSVEPPSSSLFANAMEDYQAGRHDAAIAGFEHVLKNNPKDYRAHFQLAITLQDKKKDYLGALVHYSLYLKLRPEDDKTPQASDRMQVCKDMLLEEHARKTGNAPVRKADSSSADKKLSAENTRLKAEVARLQRENGKLSKSLDTLRKLVLGQDGTGKGRMAKLNEEAKKMLAELRESDPEDSHRPLVIPTDKQLLEDDGDDGPLVSSPSVKDQMAKAKGEETAGPSRPTPIKKPPLIVDASPSESDPKPVAGGARAGTSGGGLNGLLGGGKKPSAPERPDTYKIQPKETLSDIAERYYGSRNKWREIQKANMATIPADGRVKAGQVIKLP